LGGLVFETRELTEGWDGNDAKTETYIWKIAVDVKESSERKFFMGHVNLIR
jgi:hypothetical protein